MCEPKTINGGAVLYDVSADPRFSHKGEWMSVAKWPYPEVRLCQSNNISTDTHHSKESALAVIRMLEKDGFGGNRITFPIETYIQPVFKGDKQNEH